MYKECSNIYYNKEILDFCKFVGEFTRCGAKSRIGFGIKSYILELSQISNGVSNIKCWELERSTLSTIFPESGDIAMLIVGKNMPYARKVRNQEFIFTVQKVQNLLKSVYGDFRFSTIRFNIDYGDGGRLSAFPNIYVKYINTSGKSITDDYDKEYSKYINSVFGSETEAVYFIK